MQWKAKKCLHYFFREGFAKMQELPSDLVRPRGDHMRMGVPYVGGSIKAVQIFCKIRRKHHYHYVPGQLLPQLSLHIGFRLPCWCFIGQVRFFVSFKTQITSGLV